MAKMGLKISEFPVTLAAALEARKLGLLVVMGAPNALRGSSHVGNLSASEALQVGALGALATDYSPLQPWGLPLPWRRSSCWICPKP